MRLLTQYEERLSNVPRWNIVRTIQKQMVDQHSFRVAIIAKRLALHWGEDTDQADVMEYALLHDQYEAFTGDIPSPAGRLMDKDKLQVRFDDHIQEYVDDADPAVKAIVKAADYIEALIFIAVEKNVGNHGLQRVSVDIATRLYNHLAKCGKHDMYQWIVDQIKEFEHQEQDPLK